MYHSNKGFSLIEVLVASFILFLVIGTVTVTFSGAVKSTLSASESINLYGYTPLLGEHITHAVRTGERGGNGQLLHISYSWDAELAETKPFARHYDAVSFEYETSGKSAYLWNVRLITSYRDRSITHNFKVVSWQ